jgi:hypothetical protein
MKPTYFYRLRALTRKKKVVWGVFLSSFAIFSLGGGEMTEGKEKVTLGLVENVILLPWKVKLPARIDTGATTSSLDAREITIQDQMVQFRLPEKYGGLQLKLPIVDWRTVRSAEARERRPVVEVDLCVGPQKLRVRVNLNDRSRVKYPLIIGRNVLRKNFVVDCMRNHCAPPVCAEDSPK